GSRDRGVARIRFRALAATPGSGGGSRPRHAAAPVHAVAPLPLDPAHRRQQLVRAGRFADAGRPARTVAVLPQVLSLHAVPARARGAAPLAPGTTGWRAAR